jgi:FSR family fosmidomycin resistance protein-like MFS transporter
MICALLGVFFLSLATSFTGLLFSSALIGIASSTFHPEASRVARMASGGRFGFAQSTFQVGGNLGTALGPLVAAAIIIPFGQKNFAWLMLLTLVGIFILTKVSAWYGQHLYVLKIKPNRKSQVVYSRKTILLAFGVLAILIFSKYIYMASITSYYTFYLIEKFNLSIPQSQAYLFVFLGSVALGTFLGGPIGDKIGRKMVIWVSILGAAPFTLLLPYADLQWTVILSILIGFMMSSAFAAIVVYAQELVPTKVGLVAGIFFGLMFGIGGIGAAILGAAADNHGIAFVYNVCSYLPLIGILTVMLPHVEVD